MDSAATEQQSLQRISGVIVSHQTQPPSRSLSAETYHTGDDGSDHLVVLPKRPTGNRVVTALLSRPSSNGNSAIPGSSRDIIDSTLKMSLARSHENQISGTPASRNTGLPRFAASSNNNKPGFQQRANVIHPDGRPVSSSFGSASVRMQQTGLRMPPSYDSVRHIHSAPRASLGQRQSFRPRSVCTPTFSHVGRALRFAPPLRPPPPPPRVIRNDAPRNRDFRDYVPPVATESPKNLPFADTLAKISELAEITRASIPMPPLEDDGDANCCPVRESFRASSSAHSQGPSQRELMPPPSSPSSSRNGSPALRKEERVFKDFSRNVLNAEAVTRAEEQLGIYVEIVQSVPPPANQDHFRFSPILDPNLSFLSFANAVTYLSLDEPPLNPLEIESSKEILISVFGPKMTLYRCGGCDSSFVFKDIFADHFHRAIAPYRLRCNHCKDVLKFSNVCQVRDHVRSHGVDLDSGKGFVLTVAETSDDGIIECSSDLPMSKVAFRSEVPQKSPTGNAPSHSYSSPKLPIDNRSGENPNSWTNSIPSSAPMSVAQMQRVQPPLSLRQTLAFSRMQPVTRPVGSSIRNHHPGPEMVRMQAHQPLRSPVPRHSVLQSAPSSATSPFVQNIALQQMRFDQEKTKLNTETKKLLNSPSATLSRGGPTITVDQILEREISRVPSGSAGGSFNSARRPPRITCIYCQSGFDGQSGLTHHFQRCKDVKAASEFYCVECKLVCCNSCSFLAHKQIHLLRKGETTLASVCCPECGIHITTAAEVVNHVERRCVHWCRMLCFSYSCQFPQCRYHGSDEDAYLSHIANEHSYGDESGKCVCPVCKLQFVGSRTEMMRHLTTKSACRQRVLQEKVYFFAYRCSYCGEKEAPVFETKAVMRDHILAAHHENSPRSMSSLGQLLSDIVGSPPVQANPFDGSQITAKRTPSVEEVSDSFGSVPRANLENIYCVLCHGTSATPGYPNDVEALETHIYKVHIPKSYPTNCVHCRKPVTGVHELFGHFLHQVFKLPVNKCVECDFVSLSRHGLVNHKLAFHQHRLAHPYICGICRKVGYDSAEKLQGHVAETHGIAEAVMRTEPMHYGQKVARLMSSESGSVIQKATTSKRPAEEDMPDAKRQRPQNAATSNFACRLCEHECDSNVAFAEHVRTMHGVELNEVTEMRQLLSSPSQSYNCKVCEGQGTSFTSDNQSVFHEHIRRDHPAKETSFQCSECALQLLSLSVLQMHLRMVHSIPEPSVFLSRSTFYSGSKIARLNQHTAGASITANNNLRMPQFSSAHSGIAASMAVNPDYPGSPALARSVLKMRVAQANPGMYRLLKASEQHYPTPSK